MTGVLRLRPGALDPVRAGVVGARRRPRARAARRPPLRPHRRRAGGGVRVAPDAWRPRAPSRGTRRSTTAACGERTRRSRARIKTQLLSQRPLAGVGNIYADEALWRAGIHPARRSITRKEADRLLTELRVVLEQGIANGGTTLRDYRTPDGEPGRNQLELGAYGRAGEPCLRCGTELRRTVIDARGTTFCPTCQRRR